MVQVALLAHKPYLGLRLLALEPTSAVVHPLSLVEVVGVVEELCHSYLSLEVEVVL